MPRAKRVYIFHRDLCHTPNTNGNGRYFSTLCLTEYQLYEAKCTRVVFKWREKQSISYLLYSAGIRVISTA